MTRLRALGWTALVLFAAGCATPIPLDKIAYTGPVAVSTDMRAKVRISSGTATGAAPAAMVVAGGAFFTVTRGPAPHLYFGGEDQRAFGEALRTELVRLGLFASATQGLVDEPGDMTINVVFLQTFHNPDRQQYVLDVLLDMSGGYRPLLKPYRIVSTEKDSWWQKMNTNAYEGKAKAARLLLEKLIPDIELYVAATLRQRRQ